MTKQSIAAPGRAAVALCFVAAMAVPDAVAPLANAASNPADYAHTMSATRANPTASPSHCERSEQSIDAAPVVYNRAEIASPANDTALRNNAGNVAVVGRIDPQPRCGHRVQLLLDDVPVGAPAQAPEFALENIDRGTHQLQLRIVNDAGTILFTGRPSTFHLLRHSRLHP